MTEQTAEKFTFEKRVEGAEKLVAALTEAGIKAELKAEKGKTELFDSVRIRLSDKNGVPASDLAINGKGYINVAAVYSAGEQRVTDKATDIAEELQGAPVSDKFADRKKPAPGGGSFLGKL